MRHIDAEKLELQSQLRKARDILDDLDLDEARDFIDKQLKEFERGKDFWTYDKPEKWRMR